jgi:hypothetical protein
MAVFGRRRREIGEQTARAEAEAEAILQDDDPLRLFEDLFPTLSPPPSPPPLPRAQPVAEEVPPTPDSPPTSPSTEPPPEPGGDDPIAPIPGTPITEREPSLSPRGTEHEGVDMAHLEQSVQELLAIDGVIGVAIVDSASGMALAQGGHPAFDLGVAAAGNSNVVRAKLQTMKELGISSALDDILITLEDQYHLINVLGGGNAGLFVYLVLDRAKANLALARHKLASVSAQITI